MAVTEAEARKEILFVAKRLTRHLKLSGWDITLVCAPNSLEGDKGSASIMHEYRQAHIVIDPAPHESLADIRSTVAHEFTHIVLAPFAQAAKLLQVSLDKGDPIGKIMDEALRQAEESVISHLEEVGFPLDRLDRE